jgi:rhamnosyl/mannosyltransferase
MRVAHVFKDFFPPLHAGITRYIADVATATAARGFDVEVHVAGVSHSRRDYLPDGVVVHRHGELARVLSSPISFGLPLDVSRLDVDLVHLHMPNPLGEIGAVLNRRGSKVVATFHAQLGRQQLVDPLYARLRERVLRRCAFVFVASDEMARAEELAHHRHLIRVLPYGVSPAMMSLNPTERPPDPTMRLLFAGRLVYYKGIDVLLRAVARLTDLPVRLTIVGDGPLRASLECLAEELGIGDRVDFAGSVPDAELVAHYESHDVFVMPSVSRAEAFGLAMCEAMANGMPAISTRLGTATDWVNLDGVTGMVVPPNDVDALAESLRKLGGDVELRERLGEAARERARTEFSFETHVDALVDAYREVGG